MNSKLKCFPVHSVYLVLILSISNFPYPIFTLTFKSFPPPCFCWQMLACFYLERPGFTCFKLWQMELLLPGKYPCWAGLYYALSFCWERTHRRLYENISNIKKSMTLFVHYLSALDFEVGFCYAIQAGSDLLCSSGWPLTHSPPVSASGVLGLQLCATVLSFFSFSLRNSPWHL